MLIGDIKVGQKVWYLYRLPGSPMPADQEVEVLWITTKRVQILALAKKMWVRAENLRSTT